MPSRLRIAVTDTKGHLRIGGRAVGLIRKVPAAHNFPACDWGQVDREGQFQSYWINLRVWRERRGISPGASAYRTSLGRHGSDTTSVARQRAEAMQRRVIARNRTPLIPRFVALVEDSPFGRAGAAVARRETRTAEPRPIRPGIFSA